MKYAVILLMMLPLMLAAEPWKLDSDFNFSFTQSAYNSDWVGTELSNITWVANSNTSAEKQLKSWLLNRTTLKLAFGQTHLQKVEASGEREWQTPQKSTDKIDLESLFRFTTQGWVDPFAAVRMESQFIDESDPDLTRIINPMLLTESAGIMRSFYSSENTSLDTRFGAAFRERLNREALQSDLTRELETTVDGGLESVTEYKTKLPMMDTNFKSRLGLYQALFNSQSDEVDGDWKALDVAWENALIAKLWGLLSANLTFELRYEKEAVHAVQWKEILGLGFSYTLF